MGVKTYGTIDYSWDNRAFSGNKSDMKNQPYIFMINSIIKDYYNILLGN